MLVAIAALQISWQDPTYVRDQQGWLRVENGHSFRVQADVISAQFKAPVDDVHAAVAALAGVDARLEDLTVLRSNRLGIIDMHLPFGADPLAIVAVMRDTHLFSFAEETTFGVYHGIPNDSSFAQQWNMHNVGQTGGTTDADVDAPEAWDIQDGHPSVVIAIADSGTEWFHPDLSNNIWNNSGEIPGNFLDDDANGYVDDIRGWDFDNNDNDPSGTFTHGTWVAGVVGAQGGNGIGISGLAGGAMDGQGCSMMPLNVGSSFPNGAVLDDAILYAADNGAKVITMSLSVGSSAAIDAAITAATVAQVFIDCSAGNGGGVGYPANKPEVMAVGGTNDDDNWGFFSTGPQIEVSAPGSNVYMTEMGGSYGTASGTSFSSPHVAALAGLLFSEYPTLTPSQVRTVIRSTADDVAAPGYDQQTGDGRINAEAALLGAKGFIAAEVMAYGAGLPGTGGNVPQIGSPFGQLPTVGSTNFSVTVNNALPNASAVFVAGIAPAAIPYAGGQILIDVGTFNILFPVTINGAGQAQMPFFISGNPAFAGAHIYCQWVVIDPGAVLGKALSGGLEVVIGS
jgi:subtilisin family serine protease